jgi:lipopolysaccharide export system protein LptA
MTAGKFWIGFGAKSQVRQLSADGQVRTESQAPNNAPSRVTTSDHLAAYFSESTQQTETVEQTGNFRYQEGQRQARGERAFYHADSGLTELTGLPGQDPQVWEPSGRVIARKITLNEKTNEAFAEQNVRATQMPQPGDKPNALLAKTDATKSDPVNAVAERLRWDRKSGITRYEGGPSGRTRLWQGQNVVEGKVVEMDRSGRRLTATGEAFSFLVEEGKEPLRVNSERLTYTDEDRHARYEGNVILRTQDMVVTAAAVDAWLLPAEDAKAGESRLDRALATGNVRLDQPRRPAEGKKSAVPARTGRAERADYLASKDTIVLSGGNPIVTDELRGSTTGRELTYHIADDRITVVGDDNVRTLTEHRVTKKSR